MLLLNLNDELCLNSLDKLLIIYFHYFYSFHYSFFFNYNNLYEKFRSQSK